MNGFTESSISCAADYSQDSAGKAADNHVVTVGDLRREKKDAELPGRLPM